MTTTSSFDITPFLGRDEGQHFDRKSMFDGEEGKKRPRDRRKVRDQVAEQAAGFANAEGGVLILGIEDDHEITRSRAPARRARGAARRAEDAPAPSSEGCAIASCSPCTPPGRTATTSWGPRRSSPLMRPGT